MIPFSAETGVGKEELIHRIHDKLQLEARWEAAYASQRFFTQDGKKCKESEKLLFFPYCKKVKII